MRTLFLSAATITSLGVVAQPLITDAAPVLGQSTWTEAQYFIAGPLFALEGDGVVWDFTTGVFVGEEPGLEYWSVPTGSLATSFPTATRLVQYEASSTCGAAYALSAEGMFTVGYWQGAEVTQFDAPVLYWPTPFAYGDLYEIGTTTLAYTGHGSIITPYGTVDDVVQMIRYDEGSFELRVTFHTVDDLYRPIAWLDQLTEDGYYFNFRTDLVSALAAVEPPEELRIVPNPSTGPVHIHHPDLAPGDGYLLYDARGQLVSTGLVPGPHFTLPRPVTGAGMYVLHCATVSGTLRARLVVQ
ncbi:MAG: T9SS type A sorting domain-containing protein [Flavobacteriales bacterium]|nr:T9SS type A sorting domain-containing protein [Flavobacteriales bacterium]